MVNYEILEEKIIKKLITKNFSMKFKNNYNSKKFQLKITQNPAELDLMNKYAA